ncbi:MAG: bifunctional 5,10-methylenetetrahydrofolate dehydrogenase/5,10-methenyltetrahydrofolate cyclohydrolase [Candidatus Undinarchaeales archaeon]
MAKVIDGKKLAEKVRKEIKSDLKAHKKKPVLSVILAGKNPASKMYVKKKKEACEEAGIECNVHNLSEHVVHDSIISLIEKLNENEEVDGIMVQLPLPKDIDTSVVLESISPEKDVDGLTSASLGKVAVGDETFAPATAKGVIEMLESENAEIKGKHAVIVGHSNIVGKPIALMLLNRFATVTVCHVHSQPIDRYTKEADILVSAVGKADLIKSDMVKEDAVVIDVGITKKEDGSISGDVDFEKVKKKASKITPVPGGVGPMTIAVLMRNVVEASESGE